MSNRITRFKKALVAFFESYRNDMSFSEHSVYVRAETLTAVAENDKIIKNLEVQASRRGSVQWNMREGFLKKCLEKKFTPELLALYFQDNRKMPGLNMEVHSYGDVGKGLLRQEIKITLYNELLGNAQIITKMERGRILAKIDESVEVK